MKVQSWKTLLVTLFAGGGLLAYTIYQLYKDATLLDWLWLALCIGMIIKGLYVSFSRTGYEDDIRQAEIGKQIYRDKFGKWALLVQYLPLVFVLLAGLVVLIFPITPVVRVIGLLLMLAAPVSAVWLMVWYSRAKEQYKNTDS
ncbi:MAG: hypothetical protein ACOX7F_00295 [Eubacteriales bacterium]|jgi:hypothetical protein